MLALLEQVPLRSPDDAQTARIAAGHVVNLGGYLRANANQVINYRACRSHGGRISSSAVEGTVDRLVNRRLGKSQHMCWTKGGAQLLLQVRSALLNNELPTISHRWYPELDDRRLGLPWLWQPQCS